MSKKSRRLQEGRRGVNVRDKTCSKTRDTGKNKNAASLGITLPLESGQLESWYFHLGASNGISVAPAAVLFQSSSIASSKMSASGAPTNVAFPPSPTHLFTAFSSAWLWHKYSMGFVTGVPPNAKTKAASSGRFELDPSSSRSTFLCCLFLCFFSFARPTRRAWCKQCARCGIVKEYGKDFHQMQLGRGGECLACKEGSRTTNPEP